MISHQLQPHIHVMLPRLDGIRPVLLAINPSPSQLRKEAQRHDQHGEEDMATIDYETCIQSSVFPGLRPAIRAGYRELFDARPRAKDKDYLYELVCRDHVGHWTKDRMPLRIYIPEETQSDGFSTADRKVILDCLEEWIKLVPQDLSYELVRDIKDSDMRFSQKRNKTELGPTQIALGHTIPLVDKPGKWSVATINKVNIDIARASHTADDSNESATFERRRIFLHEIGHALGVNGHSCNAGDIMFFTTLDEENGEPHLSNRDKETLRKIYTTGSIESEAENIIRDRAAKGDKYALYRLAQNLSDAETLSPKDKKEIYDTVKRSADAGLPIAQTGVASLCLRGDGCDRNTARAIHYLEMAARQDAGSAYLELAGIYDEGAGVLKDPHRAETYYKQALPFGSRAAQMAYADFLCYQKGDYQSYAKAIEHYTTAAGVLSTEAMARLSTLYAKGLGTDKSPEKSKFYRDKALAIIHCVNPKDASAYFMRGRLWRSVGEAEKAIDDYTEALKLDPSKATVYIKRALAYFAIGNPESAIQDLKAAIKNDPDEPTNYLLYALCELTCNRPRESLDQIKKLRERAVDPGSNYVYGLIYGSIAYGMLKDETQFKSMLVEAKKRTVPGCWPRPLVDFLNGDISTAQLEKQSKGDSQDAETKVVIALVDLANGNKDQCIKQLEWVKDYGDERFYEHSLAVTLLSRIGQKKQGG